MCRVLCIEDDVETRILIKKSLEKAGMQVDAVWGGEKGLEACRNTQFDCVLVDVVMPGMDGLEVLQSLKRHDSSRRLKVIILTGHTEESLRRRALDAGADAFISKPFRFPDLIAEIRKVVTEQPALVFAGRVAGPL